jgi:hypothetical protein
VHTQEAEQAQKLAEKLATYKKRSFPDPGGDPDLQDIDEGLLEYDYKVTSYVSRLLQGSAPRKGKFRRWQRLGRRIRRLVHEGPELSESVHAYLEIYQALEELLDAAEAFRKSAETESRTPDPSS